MKDLRGLPWHLAWLFSAGFEKCVSMYRLKTTLHYQVMHDDKTKYLEAVGQFSRANYIIEFFQKKIKISLLSTYLYYTITTGSGKGMAFKKAAFLMLFNKWAKWSKIIGHTASCYNISMPKKPFAFWLLNFLP